MEFKFDKKFGEKHIDAFINKFYSSYKSKSSEEYIFNLEDVEWISNQALLLLTSICNNLYENGIKFKFIFFEITNSTDPEYRRKIVNVINLWDNWKLHRTVPDQTKWSEYFKFKNSSQTFNSSLLDSLKNQFNIKVDDNLYNRIRITPFIRFEKVDDYIDEKIIENHINPIFKLNDSVSEELSLSQSSHPFINNTLSHIITKELYENFLDHAGISIFKNNSEFAFMSLSLRKSLLKYDNKILNKNFYEEELEISKDFFSSKGNFINKPIIEYSFLDFGKGITNTLKENFISKISGENIDDNEILKFAFKHYSSRHPIKKYDLKDDDILIPRGLFDVLTVVKRYAGLIIIRSNFGKILFNFATDSKDDEVKVFGTGDQFFPGTFITIYLPAFNQEAAKFDTSAIKPIFQNLKNRIPQSRFINLIEIYNKVDHFEKEKLYSKLVEHLKITLQNNSENIFINYISFKGCTDERLNKISLFFLLSDYEINVNNSAIIFNPPEKEFISSIKDQILNLSSTVKEYILHPVPLVYSKNDIDWLGIYDEDDKKKLSNFFYEGVIQSVDDFNMPDKLVGNFQFLEGEKNLYSLLSYVDIEAILDSQFIDEILIRNNCIRKDGLYLCNGNYYQNEFVQLLELLNNEEDCKIIVSQLVRKLGIINQDVQFIAITSSSHKILNTLIKLKSISKSRCIYLDSYLTFENDIKINEIIPDKKYILVGDVLSGGSLARKLEKILLEKGSYLDRIAVLINTIDKAYENSREFLEKYSEKIYYAHKHPVKKYKRYEISSVKLRDIIRINPYTNLPNVFSDSNTLKNLVLLPDLKNDFLDYIGDDDILINYKIFNNLIHPYFFKLQNIIKNENILMNENNDKSLMNYAINEALKNKITIDKNLKFFYPRGSSIEFLDFDIFKNKVLKNHSVELFELERFNTKEGWKFPHTTDTYSEFVKDNNIIILDDGSCSGDSIIQMVNEIAYFKPQKIDVLSIIGRVDDHKREFFSRIKQMRLESSAEEKFIEINIHFISHWYIPTFFLDNAPFNPEIIRLQKLLTFQNLPIQIKKIAAYILETIEPKALNNNDYPFFPKIRGIGAIPKKDILRVRNEIGKVTGYRFYKENFIFFNDFVAIYNNNIKTVDRYKEIEIVCMCLLYEPYLYESLSNIMPDVKEKIEDFIDAIFFGLEGKSKLKISDLFYDWSESKKDLLHLFFIIYSSEQKLKQLNNNKITKLLQFANESFKKVNSSNYILYKLTNFFPLSKEEVEGKQKFSFLKEIIYNYISTDKIEPQVKVEFRRFYSFLNTLPIGGSFTSKLQNIKDIYWENDLPKTHAENTSYGQSLTKFIINLQELKDYYLENDKVDDNRVSVIRESWNNIKDKLLDPVISFYRTFPDFFRPYPYLGYISKIEGKHYSLINLYSEIDDYISNIEQKSGNFENFNKTVQSMVNIDKYFGQTSIIRNLFDNNYMSFQNFKKYLFNEFSTLKNQFTVKEEGEFNDFKILVPEQYCKELIIREIRNNIEFYSDKSKGIQIIIKYEVKITTITITNNYTKIIKEFSGNEGINCMKYLSDSSLFNFKYNYNTDDKIKTFKQKLIFKI